MREMVLEAYCSSRSDIFSPTYSADLSPTVFMKEESARSISDTFWAMISSSRNTSRSVSRGSGMAAMEYDCLFLAFSRTWEE